MVNSKELTDLLLEDLGIEFFMESREVIVDQDLNTLAMRYDIKRVGFLWSSTVVQLYSKPYNAKDPIFQACRKQIKEGSVPLSIEKYVVKNPKKITEDAREKLERNFPSGFYAF